MSGSEPQPGSELQSGSDTQARPHWLRRVGWLVLIWAISVGVVLLFAFLLKLVMRMVGLTG